MNPYFIDYLDNFQNKDEIDRNLADYHLLNNYILNNYYYNNFYQDHMHYMNNITNVSISSPSNMYYDCYSQSSWNTNDKQPYIGIKSNYDVWKTNNEFKFDFSSNDLLIKIPPPGFIPVEKKKIHIDTNINNITDLLDIIDKNPLDKNAEYNIDLKSLHNVRNELNKLNNMIGMKDLKKTILYQLLYFIQRLHEGKNTSDFKHTVIYGPPGTGKTEIAEIIGMLYSKLGILKKNTFKKVTRSDMIAGYLGQTAIKTKGVIEESLDGVLFIDEAYSLAPESTDSNDSYSKECLDTLCEALSNHKHNLMVIIAGYEDELNSTFFRVNKGLDSRFIWRFRTDSYTGDELNEIYRKKIDEQEWTTNIENNVLSDWFKQRIDDFPHFGRDMELLLMYTKIAHSRRIYGKPKEEVRIITMDDLTEGKELFMTNKKKQKNKISPASLYAMYV
jgi:SpoVK/Ycf46/Vps4 family AAA+-type ATPase